MEDLPAKEPVITVSLKAIVGLQYDVVRFQVKPGQEVKLILTNEDDMSHNLVFTQPGSREEVVNAALKLGASGPKMDYIPDSPKVLGYIPVLSPGQTKSVTFKAPEKPGIYPYVCTYPGHGFIMFGAMYVTTEMMPLVESDRNIPESRRKDSSLKTDNPHADHIEKNTKPVHPYTPVAPYLYRIFMPDASPASIAVHLPNNLSYCWDAGTCHLRYAWQGGFLDHTNLWQGKGDIFANITGTIFFRDKTIYPLKVNESETIQKVKYKGYQLHNRYPEFHYTLNGIDVYEQILPKEDGNGLKRTFRIPKASHTIWFVSTTEDGVTYDSSAGEWKDGKLKLSPDEARQFTIIMTRKEGVKL
jgi:azurin